jgi:chromosome segregation ATPase
MVKKSARRARAASREPGSRREPDGPQTETRKQGPQVPRTEEGLADRLEAARAIIAELQQEVRGLRADAGAARTGIVELQKAVEQLRSNSDVQLRRMADLQAQLDITLGEFRTLRERDGRLKPLPPTQNEN